MTADESRIVYETDYGYVYRVSETRYELRWATGTASMVIGTARDEDTAMRVLMRLSRYPQAVDVALAQSEA